MPIYLMQSSFQADTAFPADAIVITPHINDTGLGTDPQNLTDDLANGYVTAFPGFNGQITVKAYDVEETPPTFPKATTVVRPDAVGSYAAARELAICLSFYADRNIPRQRGRLYIPPLFVSTSAAASRPAISEVIFQPLVDLLSGLGGVDVDWCVWSKVSRTAHKVTNWWVDNAWDVQRRRGLEATERTTGTTGG